MDNLLSFYHDLPSVTRHVVDFFVVTVIIRGIFAKKISVAVEQAAVTLGRVLRYRLLKTEKDVAIWMHYQNKRLKHGHQHKIGTCNDGDCHRF